MAKEQRAAPAEGEARQLLWGEYIHRLAVGDPEVLAKLYDESSPLIYGLALRILGDPSEAEEVTLDVYTQVWGSAQNYDSSRGTAAAWLVTLARSRAIDRLRSRASRARSEEPLDKDFEIPSAEENPEGIAILEQERRRVREALATLPPEQRQAIELAYFSGLSQTELATRLGQPLGTVKTRIRLGMIKLREQLEPGRNRWQTNM